MVIASAAHFNCVDVVLPNYSPSSAFCHQPLRRQISILKSDANVVQSSVGVISSAATRETSKNAVVVARTASQSAPTSIAATAGILIVNIAIGHTTLNSSWIAKSTIAGRRAGTARAIHTRQAATAAIASSVIQIGANSQGGGANGGLA